MKGFIALFFFVFGWLISCKNQDIKLISNQKNNIASDTVRIANDTLEYEVLIIDAGFSSWLITNAKPRNFYTQSYLEARNRVWVNEWNQRVLLPSQYNPNLYEMTINYERNIDYGYEVNYLTYFQIQNNQKLGVFMPR